MRRVSVLLLLVLVVSATALWVVSTRPGLGTPSVELDSSRRRPQGDYLVTALPGATERMNPLAPLRAADSLVVSSTHDKLMHFDRRTGELAGDVVETCRAVDPRTYELTLRPGVEFSDGTPVTLADVLLPWQLAQSGHVIPKAVWSSFASLLESVQPTGERTFRMVLREVHFGGVGPVVVEWPVVDKAYFVGEIARLARSRGLPVPAGPADPRFVELLGDVVLPGPGTGAYVVARDRDSGRPMWGDGEVWLVRNPRSWRLQAKPDWFNLAGIRQLSVTDDAARLALLRAQELDFAIDPDAAQTLASHPELARHFRALQFRNASSGPWFVAWNLDRPTLQDPRVRRALAMLFDRQKIAAVVGAGAVPAYGWFSPDTGRTDGVEPLLHDVGAARALLADAGYGPPGKPLELDIFVPPQPDAERLVDLAAPDFGRAGVTLRKRVANPAGLVEALSGRAFDGMVALWGSDAWNDPYDVFHSSQTGPNQFNWSHYHSDEADRLIEAARAELDPARRRRLFCRLSAVLQRDQPVTPLYFPAVSVLVHKRFRGVNVTPNGLDTAPWWVEPEDRLHTWGTDGQ